MSNQTDFGFAFQPIIEVKAKQVFSYEVLVRGPNDEPSSSVLSQIDKSNINEFDHRSRYLAIQLASKLKINSFINLNIIPGCLVQTQYIEETLEFFKAFHLSPRQFIIEITESEIIHNPSYFMQNINKFREKGIKVAVDDFGAGYAGLNLFVNFQPDFIKLDMHLIRNINEYGPRQAIVRSIIQVCDDLGIDVIALGVETQAEYHWLKNEGIDLFQGYLISKPGFEHLPLVYYPD